VGQRKRHEDEDELLSRPYFCPALATAWSRPIRIEPYRGRRRGLVAVATAGCCTTMSIEHRDRERGGASHKGGDSCCRPEREVRLAQGRA